MKSIHYVHYELSIFEHISTREKIPVRKGDIYRVIGRLEKKDPGLFCLYDMFSLMYEKREQSFVFLKLVKTY